MRKLKWVIKLRQVCFDERKTLGKNHQIYWVNRYLKFIVLKSMSARCFLVPIIMLMNHCHAGLMQISSSSAAKNY